MRSIGQLAKIDNNTGHAILLTGEVGRLFFSSWMLILKKNIARQTHWKNIICVFAPLHYRLKSAQNKDSVDECFPLAGFIIG